MILRCLPKAPVRNLRRLARWLRVRRWWRLRKSQLIVEIRLKTDPWQFKKSGWRDEE